MKDDSRASDPQPKKQENVILAAERSDVVGKRLSYLAPSESMPSSFQTENEIFSPSRLTDRFMSEILSNLLIYHAWYGLTTSLLSGNHLTILAIAPEASVRKDIDLAS